MSNGRYAMTIVSRIIRRLPPDASCHQFCVAATKAIRDVYTPSWYHFPLLSRRGQGWSDPPLLHLATHPEERLCASAVIYSNRRREIWLVGDCQCLVGGELCENPKPYEQRLAEMRAVRVKELLATGKTPDEILANSPSTSVRGRLFSPPTAIPSSVRHSRNPKPVSTNSVATIPSTSANSRPQKASHLASTASMTAHTSDFQSKICGIAKK